MEVRNQLCTCKQYDHYAYCINRGGIIQVLRSVRFCLFTQKANTNCIEAKLYISAIYTDLSIHWVVFVVAKLREMKDILLLNSNGRCCCQVRFD